MVKPCKTMSTIISMGSLDIESLSRYTSQHNTLRNKTIKKPGITYARHLEARLEIHILLTSKMIL